ncbi:MAG TPA: cytochrome b/b6 domain-containing protein [Xanthomonadales bacterium]|nr:cytochrome b/b6 domain-containing protein [Xanthomonadales bacterium]
MSNQTGHSLWVRISHWLGAFSVLALMVSGYAILMTNPNLYWGEVGNPLVPAFLELPVSRNYQHGGWSEPTPFFETAGSPVSANRGYEILNLNSWGRSLHFLAAWVMVITGCMYLLLGLFSGHIRRRLLPATGEFANGALLGDIKRHAQFRLPKADHNAPYSLLQKLTYCVILFGVIPVIFLTGLTMSPLITSAYPVLLDIFGGYQSARTIHFFAFVVVTLFLLVHLLMVVLTGAGQHLRGMTLGNRPKDAENA